MEVNSRRSGRGWLLPGMLALLAAGGAFADTKVTATEGAPAREVGSENLSHKIGSLIDLMVGEFRSPPSADKGVRENSGDDQLVLIDRRVQVTAPAIGRHVVYWQLNSGPGEAVYRQRLLSFIPGQDGESIVQKTYSFSVPERFVDAYATPEIFVDISGSDIVESLPERCDQIWRPDANEDGSFRARVDPGTCRIWSERREQWRRIGAEARVTKAAYWQAERGFDDDQNQVFGTRPGELYRLARMAPPVLSARQIVAGAHASSGGDAWRHAKTLQLSGDAYLFRNGKVSRADRYDMYRVYPTQLTNAHTTTGKFRLDAYAGDRVLFRTSDDGRRSYNKDGPLPESESDVLGASAYGFSAIRFALDDKFQLERLPDDQIEGVPCYFVRITDPSGGSTVVAIDSENNRVRYVGWQTPRGWHVRLYSNFYWLDDPGFIQPGRVRHYYDGAKTADIHWRSARVDEPLADELFRIEPGN